MTRYHITQVNSSAGIGGGENHLLLLCRHLAAEFDFHFILPWEGPFCEQLSAQGFSFEIISMRTKFEMGARRTLQESFERTGAQLVHCHGARANWYARSAVARHRSKTNQRQPLFTTVHNSLMDYPYPGWRRRLYLRLERRTHALVDQWIAVSQAIARDLIKAYSVPRERIEVIPNGINYEAWEAGRDRLEVRTRLDIDPGVFLLIVVARMVRQKGHRYLIDALGLLKESLPTFGCLLAGDGPLRSKLEDQTRQNGLEKQVHFVGFRDDVADLLTAADAYVLPSLSEGMPLGVLEAMARGCPVIATAVSGTPEIIQDSRNGLLIPAGDVQALGHAISRLAGDSDLRAQLARGGRETVRRKFRAEQMAAKVACLYRKHLDPRRSSGEK